MNKTELVDCIAAEAGITKEAAKNALNALTRATVDALAKGDNVSILGFGTFKVTVRKARTGINPLTKKPMEIPEAKVVRFKAGSEMDEKVNAK